MFFSSLALSIRLNGTHSAKAFLPQRVSRVATFQGGIATFQTQSSGAEPNIRHHKTTRQKQAANMDQADDFRKTKPFVPLYRSEGLLAVYKPLDWTSNDVVSYIRGILERDARNRGAKPVNVRSRRNKNRIVRVGHGGTLDPLGMSVFLLKSQFVCVCL